MQKEYRTRQLNNKKWLIVSLVAALLFLMVGFAWYYQSHRKVVSEDREVMPPYYLYLVDENGTDSLRLTVGNLHPGETKKIYFGVSNQKPGDDSGASYNINKDSAFNYELQLAYTQNLPVEYKVYAVEKSGDTFQNSQALTKIDDSAVISTKNNQEMYGESLDNIMNQGQYDIYDNVGGAKFDLTTKVENETVTFDQDYYMIEITWKDGIDFSNYLKETDLVYVVVNAMQLEPEEGTTTQAN